jgi:hypothetical protein
MIFSNHAKYFRPNVLSFYVWTKYNIFYFA